MGFPVRSNPVDVTEIPFDTFCLLHLILGYKLIEFQFADHPELFPESCVSQSISPLEEKVDAVEGQTVTLSCSYEGGAGTNYLHWYRQYPGSRPEFLLLKHERSPAVTHAVPRFPRLDVNNSNDVVNLTISSAAVSDSVLYYCALAPTVTGNPDTLYRNWFYDRGETSAQTIDPLVGEVQLPEGDDLTLSCNYNTSSTSDVLQWYRQSPGFSPEFLLYIDPYGAKSDPPPRLSAEVKDKKTVDLKISSAAVSDSVLYYCALRPTVTGSPDT
ncbi:hypothetical protein NFI96_009823, partial [Prochilodus magdalenae]